MEQDEVEKKYTHNKNGNFVWLFFLPFVSKHSSREEKKKNVSYIFYVSFNFEFDMNI